MTTWSEARVLFAPESSGLRFLPEGPYALGASRFSWVGIQHGADSRVGSLNIFDTHGCHNRSFMLPGRPGFARPTDHPGKFIVGAEHELALFDIETGDWLPFCQGIDADVQNTIINDGMIWQDNILFGTKDLEFKTAKAGLYLFRGSDRRLFRLRADQICSNGKAVVADAAGHLSLLDIDTPTRKVVRYGLDIARGCLTAPTTAIDLASAVGFPDGMVLTPDKNSLIISFYNPAEAAYGITAQYSLQTGQCEHEWRTPGSPQNTCPLLLPQADGRVQLIITTAVEHMPADRLKGAPGSGCLYVADTDFRSEHLPVVNYPIGGLA